MGVAVVTARAPRGLALVRGIVWGLGIGWCLAFVVVCLVRISFPLELEWMEGGVLHQALRFRRGEALYPPPGPDFVPFLYTPLYPILLSLLGTVLPLDFGLGRGVSVLASMALGFGAWRAVGREGKPRAHQIAALALIASGYVFTFRWLDLVRADALAMALILWAAVLLRDAWGDPRKAAIAGVLMAAAFWTKQTAAVFVVASAIGGLWVAPRQLWIYAATIAILAGAGMLWANAASDGWLWRYVFELHQSHAFNAERFRRKTWGMFVHAMPWLLPALLISLGALVRPWLGGRRRLDRERDARLRQYLRAHRGTAYWGLLAATGLFASALGYATQWAEPNAFLPGVVFLSVFVGVALPQGGVQEGAALGCVGAQLLGAALVEPVYAPIQANGWSAWARSYRWQDLGRTLPSAAQREVAAQTRSSLEGSQGPVFALARPYWSVIAGGSWHVGSMNLHDVLPEDRQRIQGALRERLEDNHYAQVWLEGEPPSWLIPALSGYQVMERRHGAARARPLSGYMSEAGMTTPYREDQLRLGPVAQRQPGPGGVVLADFEDGTAGGFELGGAWGQRPVRGITPTAALGPFGGEYVLSSAARGGMKGRGIAFSAAWRLPADGAIELWLGTGATVEGLAVSLVREDTDEEIRLPLTATRLVLVPTAWPIAPSWRGAEVRLRLSDQSAESAIFIDDVWLTPASG